jgi:hypothetical protein
VKRVNDARAQEKSGGTGRNVDIALRELLVALVGEKVGLKVIEKASQCPQREKNRCQGNREGFSMPVKRKK